MAATTALLLAAARAVAASAAGPAVVTVATSAQSPQYQDGFAFPHMGGASVVFTGYGSGTAESISSYSTVTGQTSTLVATSSGAFAALSGAASAGGRTAFVGQRGAVTGIYVEEGGAVRAVAETSSGGSSGFTSVNAPSIDVGGAVAFQGSRGGVSGIFLAAEAGASVVELVNSTVPIPRGGGKLFTCLSNPSIEHNTVAFFGSSCDGSSTAARRNKERMFRSRTVGEHALHDPSTNLVAGLYLATADSKGKEVLELRIVADLSTPVPGAGANVTFQGFSDPVASRELVAFVAATSAGELGVYAYGPEEGTLHKVADTTTAVPGSGTQGSFGDFPYAPSVSGRTVVFYAAAGAAQSGVYVAVGVGSKGHEAQLTALITEAAALDGEAIAFLGLGASATNGEVAAFYAVTSTNGVYTVSIPSTNNSFTI